MKYIDLFAGCGGLSLGLEKSNFELALAVEKSDLAARTFCFNYINKNSANEDWWKNYLLNNLEEQYANKLIISPVGDVLKNKNIITSLKQMDIDLIAGGPPCQGFSMAGKRQKTDPRNKLVWDFLDFVKEINPKFVLIENVIGINRSFDKNEPSSFEQLRAELKKLNYFTQGFEVNAKNYGVPQNRPRMIIFGVRNDIVKNKKIENDFLEIVIKDDNLKIATKIRPQQKTEKYFVKDAFEDLNNEGYYKNPTSKYAQELRKKQTSVNNHNIRKHSEKVIQKFELIAWLFENNISSKILRDIANKTKTPDDILLNLPYPIKLQNGKVLANSELEFRNLILNSASKKQIQKILELNKVAPTVMSGSDDCIHPIYYRGLTVREMARLQSFPDDFIFLGKETTGGKMRKLEVPQYTQVGNAVPPLLAEALGKLIQKIIQL